MDTIEASFKIVTPMFVGGDKRDVDLRPPSIKGALRFWWRAIHWGQCIEDTATETEALKRLYQLEADLFGAAVKEERYGQGLFSLKLKNIEKNRIEETWPSGPNGAGYIGYGINATNDEPHQKGLLPTQFSLTLILKKKISGDQTQQLKNTLKAWGLLGGLGSRARRGYGSVALVELDQTAYQFKTDKDYFLAIQNLINGLNLAPYKPLFTAFNQDMKISSLTNQNKNYRQLMDEMGNKYQKKRQLMDKTSDRVVFGLPLKTVDTNNRRSSPLMFHVHELETGHIGIFSFIPADFHFANKYNQQKMQPLFKSVEKFMDTMEAIYP